MSQNLGQPCVFSIAPDAELLRRAPVYSALGTDGERLGALGCALEASPPWQDLTDAVLVVRTEPTARLAVIGYLTTEQQARVASLAGQIETTLRRLHYVDWAEAESATAELAEKIWLHYGHTAIDEMRFTAIPRGGFIVLGMLAYTLGLRRDQVGGPDETSRTGSGSAAAPVGGSVTVVVDDCALTGLRLRRFLAGHEGTFAFAHLYSHPELRAAVRTAEPRVTACLAARDLQDLATAVYGNGVTRWRARWSERSDPGIYWIGLTEHICFAWNEPDVTIWNPVTEKEEAAWRVLPPRACLKNRRRLSAGDCFWRQPQAKGGLRVGSEVVWAPLGEQLVVANCVSGEAYAFTGVARAVWEELLRLGEPTAAAEALGAEYQVDSEVLRRDVEEFLMDAVGKGLLVRQEV